MADAICCQEYPLKNHSTFDHSMQWLSRTIAVLIFMVSPGLLGMFLDSRLGTSLLMPTGFLIGIALATTALVVLAQKLAPPARGKPLADDDTIEPQEKQLDD